MTKYDEIKQLCSSVIQAPWTPSQLTLDIVEGIQADCDGGLIQPHAVTREGRVAIGEYDHKLTTLLEATGFKDANEQAFMVMLQDLMSWWNKRLDLQFFADGTPRPLEPNAVRPGVTKTA